MIRTKIIVVAQRDEWEGHLRLMEALASGAMVIADKTLAMPSGLVDGESIVLYDSAQSLKDAIYYYLNPKNDKERLSIAKRGWEVAMGRHRSWHRVEEIIFGKPQSQVDQPLEADTKATTETDSKEECGRVCPSVWKRRRNGRKTKSNVTYKH